MKEIVEASVETRAIYGSKNGHPKWRVKQTHDEGATVEREATVIEIFYLSRLPSVNVELINGGFLYYLPFPGGNLSLTGRLHGDFIQPIVGQRVMVKFSEGDIEAPYISNLIWRPTDSLELPSYRATFQVLHPNEGDIHRGHNSGGCQIFSGGLGGAFPTIKTQFDLLADVLGGASIIQEKVSTVPNIHAGRPALKLGDAGGTTQAHLGVATEGGSAVITLLGPQLILPSFISPGPRAGVGTSVYA